jgi:hypothetical protein
MDIQYGTFCVHAAARGAGRVHRVLPVQDASEEESGTEVCSAEPGAVHTVYYTTQPFGPVDAALPGTDFTCVGFAASAGERAAD